MGSYCILRFDDLDVCEAKSFVPREFAAVFQESDRVETIISPSEGHDHDGLEIAYEASRETVMARLDLLGATEDVAESRFVRWLEEEREVWNEWLSDPGGEWASTGAEALDGLNYDEWKRLVPGHLKTRFVIPEPPRDERTRLLAERHENWLWFDGHASHASMRALIEACPDIRKVRLDVTELVEGGYIDRNHPVCGAARALDASEQRPLAPIVVLAEGRSDIAVLRRGLKLMFPERESYFTFFDHDDLKVDGGTGYLVKFLKAFAAARVPIRLVALFDNDVAGLQALAQATQLGLPATFAIMRLPDSEVATRYPTIGPQGRHVMDVNGQAAGIEMYLGIEALTGEDGPSPVRWTGYVRVAKAYQGEVEDKAGALRRFFSQSASLGSLEAQRTYPDLARIWTEIFDTARRSALKSSGLTAFPT